MRDIWEVGERIQCFLTGHHFIRGVCQHCGEDRR